MEISVDRIRRLTPIVGLAGALLLLILRGTADAVGFLIGAGFSLLSLRAWSRLSSGLGGQSTPPSVLVSGVFLALRYVLIAGVIYVIVDVSGITPVALVGGLLASFAAVILELLYQLVTSR